MKRLAAATTVALTFATWTSAELLENGNFADGVSYWQVSVAGGYGGPDPMFRVVDGALEGAPLHRADPGYLIIAQAVNIRKGKSYKLSYEVKGEGEGNYIVSILHVFKGKHHAKRAAMPGTSWEKVESEFVGAYDTDEKWFKKWRKATKDNTLKDGRTPRSEDLRDIKKAKEGEPPTRSTLRFSIGDLAGSFGVRNVSLVEVE